MANHPNRSRWADVTTHAFAEYAPDRANLDPNASDAIKNVVPNANGYGPLKGLSAYTDALAGVCKGAFLARSYAGEYNVFAGTATALYRTVGTTWEDVTRTSGGAYNLASGHFWSFAQHQETVCAANVNDDIQAYELDVDTDFSQLSSDAPLVRYIWVESGFLGGGQTAASPSIIYRSGYQTPSFWTAGQRGSTSQVLPDGDFVQGLVPNQQGGTLISETKSRQLLDRPGQQVGFSVNNVIEEKRGAVAANSIVASGSQIFFVARDGFYRLGQPSSPIGAERINRTFLDDVDLDALDEIQGVVDPVRPMVWWCYKSNDNMSTDYKDKLLGYHWLLNRWCYAEVNIEWMLAVATPGYTLEEVESILGYTSIEDIPFSLDSAVLRGGSPAFGAFGTDHKLSFFEGDALEATLETADIPHGGEGRRSYVNGFRLVGDVPDAYGQLGAKANFGTASPTWTTEQQMQSATGIIHGRTDGRTVRFRTRIPAATTWNHVQGVEVPQGNMRVRGRR